MANSQLQQQFKQTSIDNQQQSGYFPLVSPTQKKVLIYTGDSPSLRPNSDHFKQDQEANSYNTNSLSPHSPSILSGKSAGRSILKPIRISMEPNSQIPQQQFNWDDKNNNQSSFSSIGNQQSSQKMQVNQQQLHQRAHSDISRTLDQKAQMLSPKIQFSSSSSSSEKKQPGFHLQLQNASRAAKHEIQPKIELNSISTTQNTMLSSNNNRKSLDSYDNSQLLILSPMRQKIMGNKGVNQSLEGPMIAVNDRIPFKINNGSSKGQFVNNNETQNNLNYVKKNTSSIDNNIMTINSEDNNTSPYHRQDQFLHTSSYLKHRLQQLDQNKFKPVNQLPFVNEEIAETTRNQTPSGNSFNNSSNNNLNSNDLSQRSNLSIFRDTQEYEESPNVDKFQGKQNQYYSLRSPDNKASLSREKQQFPDIKQKHYLDFSSVSPASRQYKSNGLSQLRNSYDQEIKKTSNYRRQNSQSDSGRLHKSYNGDYQDDDSFSGIIPLDAEMNRRKHRLLERLQANNSPNKFHYDEHFLDQRDDEMHQLTFPPGLTHPLRNIYDHRNPLRVYQLRNSIPLSNQTIIADPETYTNQLFCHANMKRQRNQQRVINLLEEQDHMMGRLIGKYKKRAEEEEEILAKKLDQLEKEKDSLVHLKYQEVKLGQLQQNLTTKLSQLKENAGFFNGKLQPSMPMLRPDMYDQCSDMYDLAFLDSILRQDQARYGRVKQRYGLPGNAKLRSKSVMD